MDSAEAKLKSTFQNSQFWNKEIASPIGYTVPEFEAVCAFTKYRMGILDVQR
jgi:hypothetical protein